MITKGVVLTHLGFALRSYGIVPGRGGVEWVRSPFKTQMGEHLRFMQASLIPGSYTSRNPNQTLFAPNLFAGFQGTYHTD